MQKLKDLQRGLGDKLDLEHPAPVREETMSSSMETVAWT
jgi:hypothetical protein